MGQYYKPVNTKTLEWLYSHNYDNGLELMEHSYVGNNFVGAVMALMVPGGKWHKAPIVWAGDYYDEEGKTPYWDMAKDENCLAPKISMSEEDQKKAILVNHTKKQFVRYDELPKPDKYGWVINPLPLLTACGNGRGGGDYHDDNSDYKKVGIWANDILSIETEEPENYKKIKVRFR